MQNKPSLVVLSGGADSTVCLYWARELFGVEGLHTITFDYGQRHSCEIAAANLIAVMAGVRSHEMLALQGNGEVSILKSTSPLVSANRVGQYQSAAALPGGIEPTFVPCRNILFLTIAANRAVALGAKVIVTGLCQEDYGGYPDCRRDFVDSMEAALNRGIFGFGYAKDRLEILTPLMDCTKRESVELAARLPGCMEALAYSHTCYNGQYPPDPHNHASILRARGFALAALPDPLILRAKKEGLLPADYPDSGLVEGGKYALVAGKAS